ncbi:MAG: hypothetical protein DDG60_09615 [Anaerolineae bacterium]|nr:MAG: hypothetical protein DDG60_09615 [Anaerolineae bacterium]
MKTRFFFSLSLIAIALGTAMSVSAQRILSRPSQPEEIFPIEANFTETTMQSENAQEAPTAIATTSGHNYTTAQALQRYTQSEILTQVVNNVEISVANLKVDDNVATVYVCYQQPKFNQESLNQLLGEWVIYHAELGIGEKYLSLGSRKLFEYSTNVSENENLIRRNPDFLPDSGVPVEEVIPASIEYECRRLEFVLENVTNSTISQQGNVRLVIYSMYTFPREGQFCAFYSMVQRELAMQGKEIAIECTEENGASNLRITGINEKDFWEMISNQFLTYKGPWEFSIPLK